MKPTLLDHSLVSSILRALLFIFMLSPTQLRAGYIDHFATVTDIGPDKVPNRGSANILVIPVIVNEPGLPNEIQMLANAEPFFSNSRHSDGSNDNDLTFGNYYRTASLKRYKPSTIIAPAIHFNSCPFSTDPSTGACTITRGDFTAFMPALNAIKTVLEQTDANLDFNTFDMTGINDGVPDGYIDGLVILLNIDFGGIALPMWRLCGPQNSADSTPESLGISFACGIAGLSDWDPVYDGVRVPWAAVSGAPGGDLATGTHISLHEFGHLLGFADLYDEGQTSTDMPYSLMGGWNYNATPQLPDALSRYLIGWGNVVQGSGDTSALLRPAYSHGDMLKLGVGEEFFLVENRVPSPPWDGDIIGGGVVIQHVNLRHQPSPSPYSFLTTIQQCVNCDPWKSMVSVEQADGLFELQTWPGNRDDVGDIFHTGDTFMSRVAHTPIDYYNRYAGSNYEDGTPSGIDITAIDTTTLGDVATVTFSHSVIADPCADLICPSTATCQNGICIMPETSTAPAQPTPNNPANSPSQDNPPATDTPVDNTVPSDSTIGSGASTGNTETGNTNTSNKGDNKKSGCGCAGQSTNIDPSLFLLLAFIGIRHCNRRSV